MLNIKRWIVRRVRLKLFSIYLLFTLTIYLFLCLNQMELKETSLPWKYQQQPQALQSKRSVDYEQTTDELVYFAYDHQYSDKKLSTMRHQIEKHLLQMESKLVKNRSDNSTTNTKKALIKYDDVNNLNFLYRKLLQSNGYQVFFNANISDWTVLFDMQPNRRDNQFNNYLDPTRCSSVRFKNSLENLSILYSNRAYFCAAFSVIYKEINELNKFSKVTTSSCFVLPDQKLEFESVAIALGQNVDWLIKKSSRHPSNSRDKELEYIFKNNQKTNRIISEKVWNIGPMNKKSKNKKSKKASKLNNLIDNHQMTQQMNNQLDNHIRPNNYFDTNPNRSAYSYFDESLDLKRKNHKATLSNKRQNPLYDFNTDSLQFAIEIIDSFLGKVFRSNHHSNDILQSINFQNFELQKMNNSMVYVQKSSEKSEPSKDHKNSNFKNAQKPHKKMKNKSLNKLANNRSSNQTDQPLLLQLFSQKGKQFLNQFEQYRSIEKRTGETTIVEKKIDNLYRINNDTISIRQYVLIKNLNPLRAYLFNEGLVFFMQNTTSFKSKTGGYWLFSHLRNYFNKQYPDNNLYSNLVEAIDKFLLITEFHLISNFRFLERFQFFSHPYDLYADNQHDDFEGDQFSRDDQHFATTTELLNKLKKESSSCNLKQYQLIEIELVLADTLEFYIVDVNLEPSLFDNQQTPYKEFDKQSKKELLAFQKNLLNSVWRLVGLIKPSKSGHLTKQTIKQNFKGAKSAKNKKHVRRSVTLKKIKDLPAKYVDQLSKQSSKVRRRLLFVNELNYKHKLINNWQANLFRRTLSRLLVEQNVGIMGLNCLVSHKLCLTEQDLNNILLGNIELTRNGNNKFEPLYPSTQMCSLNSFIEELSTYVNPSQASHRTADLHLFLCKLELQLNSGDKEKDLQDEKSSNSIKDEFSVKNDYVIENLPEDLLSAKVSKVSNESSSKDDSDTLMHSKDYYSMMNNDISSINLAELDETMESINYLNSVAKLEDNSTASEADQPEVQAKDQLNCSLREEDLHLIDSLRLEPKLNLSLKFNSKYQTQYKVVVNYDLIRVQLIVNVKHCNGKIKLNQLDGPSVNVSLNLGIGLNRIVFHVENDLDAFEQSKTYQLVIQRLSLREVSSYDQSSRKQFICQINQIYKNERCGLSKVKQLTELDDTRIEQQMNSSMKMCRSGDEEGRWLIRCNGCENLFTCDASSQIWLPYNCTYRRVNRPDLEKCFKNKNLLFIGDSTIRGMMHYLIEKMNGSLNSYEKIHNIRIYSNLNKESTVFGFSYYPRFWIANNNMPSLSWTVSKLRNMIKLDNLYSIPDSETVIIIGGVHWLSTKHITKIHNLVQTYPNTRLILKSLGSGFHQPLQSVHYLPIEEQRKLIDHNQNLINLAKQRGLQILDTFNASNFVYDAFFPGSCSCHFYKSSIVNNNGFHISGLINEMYSQMMANLICS